MVGEKGSSTPKLRGARTLLVLLTLDLVTQWEQLFNYVHLEMSFLDFRRHMDLARPLIQIVVISSRLTNLFLNKDLDMISLSICQ